MTSQRSLGAEAPEPRPSGLDDDFGFAIGAVFRAYAKAVDAAVGDIPGGPRGYLVLAAAATGEAGSQKSLAERLGVDRTVMTYLLDDLEAAGLVERRPDPADRRSRHVFATEHGAERREELRARVDLVEQHLLGALPEESREAFRGMLCTLARHVTGRDGAADPCQVVIEFGIAEEAARTPRRGRRRSAN
ncbi:MarR family winged helix-turn-helix transcriptional regulator [Actinacidiphila glaucinigra]|uniref:MarR family winged helix-turn-helix transcriptional regulator n=1 Tax=Actinacidiphila glaucinigra TaxID=235986 RepID=UPI0037C81620